jgi:FixJ family two-component response regulator
MNKEEIIEALDCLSPEEITVCLYKALGKQNRWIAFHRGLTREEVELIMLRINEKMDEEIATYCQWDLIARILFK